MSDFVNFDSCLVGFSHVGFKNGSDFRINSDCRNFQVSDFRFSDFDWLRISEFSSIGFRSRYTNLESCLIRFFTCRILSKSCCRISE